MNEVIKNILERRSVKKYTEEKVKKEDLDQILEAGLYAPSGANKQGAIMVAVQDSEVINQLERLNAKVVGRDPNLVHNFYGAKTIVLTLADKNVPTSVYDASLVMENMMLAAHSLGLGSCWIHRGKLMFETEEGKEILKGIGVEGEYEGVGICLLGYAAIEPKAAPRKENRIYYKL